MKVYNIGSINIDYTHYVDHLVQPGETIKSRELKTCAGGKGLNQSMALAKAGAEVYHVGKINQNDSWLIEQLKQNAVHTEFIETCNSPTGHAIIQVDSHGENSIITCAGSNREISLSQIDSALENTTPGDWVLIQNKINQVKVIFNTAKKRNLNIAFNPAPMDQTTLMLPLHLANLLVVNAIEGETLSQVSDPQDIINTLSQNFPDTELVLTLGEIGAWYTFRNTLIKTPAPKVTAIDTIGAGDTFIGFFLAAKIRGQEIQACLTLACQAAALSTTINGASSSIPEPSDLPSNS